MDVIIGIALFIMFICVVGEIYDFVEGRFRDQWNNKHGR